MKKIVKRLSHTDIVALVIIGGGFILMFYHIDTIVGGILTMVTGFYFGNKFNK